MILYQFRQWADQSIEAMRAFNISAEIRPDRAGMAPVPDPSEGIVHESAQAMGQVTVWASGQMEYEVVSIDSGQQLLWNYHENVGEAPDFDTLLISYFELLKS